MPISHEAAIKNTMAVNNLRICLCTMKLDHTIIMGINYDPKLGEFVLILGDELFADKDIFAVLQKAADHQ